MTLHHLVIIYSIFILEYISSLGSSKCELCPAGYSCSNNGDPSKNQACVPGSYSIAGATVCTPCQAGSFCPSTA